MPDEIPPNDMTPLERMTELMPWLGWLPENERPEVLTDLVTSVKNSLELGNTLHESIERMVTELAAWKATAEVHADPELYAALTAPVRPEDLVEAPRPVAKGARRCGASLPHEDAEDGWYWCILPMGHKGVHHEGDPSIGWHDGEIVEVYSTDLVRAVPSHIHDFVGDEDTCVAQQGCQLTWGGSCAQDTKWEAAQRSGVPLEDWDTPLCPSNIPDPDKADSAIWCFLPAGHEGDHRRDEHTWTPADAARRAWKEGDDA